MQNVYNYKEFAILYVDDEEQSLKYFKKAFASDFRIFTATSARAGFKILEEHKDELGILMTDERMPGGKGVHLLEQARQLSPRVLRILATAFADFDAAIQAVNSGAIYKYVSKPWNVDELKIVLRQGLELFIVQRERDQLLREKFSALHNLMVTDRLMSLGILAAGLGHHVRNSLVAVRTFLDLAPSKLQEENVRLDELRNPHFWREFYEQVQTQVQRITGMLSDLGGASGTPSIAFADKVKLPEVLADVLEKMKDKLDKKKIIVENQIPKSLPALMVEKAKFYRVFELLLTDELVSLPQGGQIWLRAQALPPSGGSDPRVQLELSDNGPGLPEAALRSVFDPFFVRNDNPQEFGINLMICYLLVYHHGGTIKAKNQPDRGAAFTLTFPTKPAVHSACPPGEDFLPKMLLNEMLWEKLLAGGKP
jgi:two-component system probable response regulator PhcQ